jgi:hypothetical protein
MDERNVEGSGDPNRSLMFYVSDPLVRAWGWIFLAGLGGVLGVVAQVMVSWRYMSTDGGPFGATGSGVRTLALGFQLGAGAFTCWISLLLCQAGLALRRTRDSLDPADFERSQRKLRVYFIVQGVLVMLGLAVGAATFLFVGLDKMLDL